MRGWRWKSGPGSPRAQSGGGRQRSAVNGIPHDMAKLSTLSVDGQVTIPQDVRDALGLEPGQPVEFAWDGGTQAIIRRPMVDRETGIERIKARLEATSAQFAHLREGRPTEDIMRDIRGDDLFLP
jgi:AbrB family looped-hinge helix DNA binding protein